MGIKDRINTIVNRSGDVSPSNTPADVNADTDVKNRLKNLLNRGTDTSPSAKSSGSNPADAEFPEITRKLEHERQTREGIGKFLKHPLQVLTEKPDQYSDRLYSVRL